MKGRSSDGLMVLPALPMPGVLVVGIYATLHFGRWRGILSLSFVLSFVLRQKLKAES